MTPRNFVSALADFRLENVFNPYSDRCLVHDRHDAPARRRRNLQRFLEGAITKGASTMWVGRDLGYRGGRRTGVPLTDEIHLDRACALVDGARMERATVGPIVAERTAAVVWSVLAHIRRPVVLWNVFPFHPHEANDPLSNRAHSRNEREATLPLLVTLAKMMDVKEIIAIGRDAQSALSGLGLRIHSVRHPSYGGQSEFVTDLSLFYGIDPAMAAVQPRLNFSQPEEPPRTSI